MEKKAQETYPLKEFYSKIFKRYDLVNALFTFGLDRKWRRDAAKICMSFHPEKVIDLCCGTGDLSVDISRLSGDDIEIKGCDFNEEMLTVARRKIQKKNLKNIEFICGDAANLPFENNEYDCITIAFGFRNLTYENPELNKHMEEINRVLKQDGKLIILESGIPSNFFFRLLYKFHLRFILIPIGVLLSGNRKAYKYLAKSAENFYSITEIDSMLTTYGFKMVQLKKYFIGAANLIVAKKLK